MKLGGNPHVVAEDLQRSSSHCHNRRTCWTRRQGPCRGDRCDSTSLVEEELWCNVTAMTGIDHQFISNPASVVSGNRSSALMESVWRYVIRARRHVTNATAGKPVLACQCRQASRKARGKPGDGHSQQHEGIESSPAHFSTDNDSPWPYHVTASVIYLATVRTGVDLALPIVRKQGAQSFSIQHTKLLFVPECSAASTNEEPRGIKKVKRRAEQARVLVWVIDAGCCAAIKLSGQSDRATRAKPFSEGSLQRRRRCFLACSAVCLAALTTDSRAGWLTTPHDCSVHPSLVLLARGPPILSVLWPESMSRL
ncbi:uncharacterized protein F5Z01DRAFT_338339 [Emericellopsis atlantica]|uniref:Uncharacterized protein n=1 Tax=Emericellopsis atlantica TaxID=2614577 RepID=A0A9P8CLC5_9HYPO|nr:uncharacterized protein F5Z01DRAFT_338339 [Emericellopsis atlantica]KAG9250947.1 hypothetical protein F5Z01DRAFT_338339 [Emericellopsis atlantica]